jgi:DNA-binding NtrC family response regulator
MKEHAILLVDADGDSEKIVSLAAAHGGRDVLVARTSSDAFQILKDQMQRLALVVVDVDPGAHGLALLEAISACADRPQIVVITALEETYMTPIATKHGAAACLGKPLTLYRLHATLSDVAARSLTCDRWGGLVPATAHETLDLKSRFRGIAAKLSPTGWLTGASRNMKS